MSCVWAHFLRDSYIVGQLWLHWVKGVWMFRCNLPPALLTEWPGSFTCHCSNRGVEQTQNKSQHTKLTLEKKFLPQLLLGFELADFRSRVRCFTNKLSRLPTPWKTQSPKPTFLSLTVTGMCVAPDTPSPWLTSLFPAVPGMCLASDTSSPLHILSIISDGHEGRGVLCTHRWVASAFWLF